MTEFSSGPDEPLAGEAPQMKAECAEVMAEVWTLLDGECTAEKKNKLRQHLEDCPPCFQFYGLEERIKGLIATRCSGEKAPDRLRERLQFEISRTTIIRGQL